jgi:hypothetical protein
MKAPVLNPLLTGHATRFMTTLPTVGLRLFPILRVPDRAAQYYVWSPENNLNIPDKIQRAPGTGFKRIVSKLTDDTYFAKDYGVEEALDNMEVKLYENFLSADRAIADRTTWVVAMHHEIRVRDIVLALSQTSSPSTKWNQANSDPIADIKAAKRVIQDATGVVPNLLTVNQDVYDVLEEHPKITAKYAYTAGGILTKDQVARALGMEEIQVAGNVLNTAAEGAAAAISQVWGDDVYLSVSRATADIKALNLGRTFNWIAAEGSGPNGIGIFSYDQEEIDSRIHRSRQFTDEKIIAQGAGYRLSNVLQ